MKKIKYNGATWIDENGNQVHTVGSFKATYEGNEITVSREEMSIRESCGNPDSIHSWYEFFDAEGSKINVCDFIEVDDSDAWIIHVPGKPSSKISIDPDDIYIRQNGE